MVSTGKGKSIVNLLMGLLLLTIGNVNQFALAQLPDSQHYGSVEYLTGGFGIDEATALKNAMPKYALAMTFVLNDGAKAAYVSDVQLVIRDTEDVTVLNVESQGPFLLAQLAPGSYQVFATYNNQTQSRQITLQDGKNARLVFEWRPSSPVQQGPESGSSADDMSGVKPDENTRWEFSPGSIPGLN